MDHWDEDDQYVNEPDEQDDWDATDWERYFTMSEADDDYSGEFEDWLESEPVEPLALYQFEKEGDLRVHENSVPVVDWHYDDSGYYAYITLNGPGPVLQEQVRALRDHSYVCPIFGHSYRPANDGHRYDWYIRVFRNDGSKPTRQELLTVMGAPAKTDQAVVAEHVNALKIEFNNAQQLNATLQDEVKDLTEHIKALSIKLRTELQKSSSLKKQNLISQGEIKRLNDEIKDRWDQISWYSDRLRQSELYRNEQNVQVAELELLQNQNNELQSQISNERSQVIALEAERDTWVSDRHELEDLWNQFEERIAELKKQLTDAQNQSHIMQARYDELLRDVATPNITEQSTAKDSKWYAALPPETLAMLMSTLLPNVELVKGSVDFISRELQDPRICLKELHMLCYGNPLACRGERVEGTQTWLELRFATGRDHLGRLYYRRLSDRTLEVLVSHKASQPQDIKWMRLRDTGKSA